MKTKIVDPKIPYSYAQMMRDILRLKEAYPGLIESSNAGFSVKGRSLPVITLGSGQKKVFMCGAHHAREYISSAYLMYSINVLAEAAAHNKKFGSYDMAQLLLKCQIHIMPMVNPDGVTLVQNGIKAVEDRQKVKGMVMVNTSYAAWKANINGVDLNRQYPALWEQKRVLVNRPASELFNGTAPATEPEVKAVMHICRKNMFKAAVSFHTKGEVIYYADNNTRDKIPHAKVFAQRLAAVSGYTMMPVSQDPGIYAAGFENWFRQQFLYPGLLVELTPSSGGAIPHNDKDFFALVWDRAKYICAEAIAAVLEPSV